MAGTTAQAQVDKKAYRNQTAGWLGVVKLDHLGAQQGHPVEPHGSVYLSDEEAILTARAPREAKDNPFVEQSFMFEDQQGQRVEKMLAPLVLITDDKDVPTDDRFTPVGEINTAKVAAEQAQTADALAAQDDSPREVATAPVDEPVLVPASSAAVAYTQPRRPDDELVDAEGERAESWVENDDRTEEPQKGSLAGSGEPAPGDAGGDPLGTRPTSAQAPPQRPAPTSVGSSAAGEEHAASRDKTAPSESAGTQKAAGAPSEQEEIGTAVPPQGEPVEGEYAQHEEVATPDAPAQAAKQS